MRCMAIHKHTKQYVIFENGTVKSLVNNNILVPHINANGYLIVSLHKVQLSVHRLVATHFIANPYGLTQVNHKDGNKSNNCVDNLEWCTAERNVQHALETGLRAGFVSADIKESLLHRVIAGEQVKDLATELGNHPNTLSKMLRNTADRLHLRKEWDIQMKENRKNAAIRNLEKNNYNRT